jgi:hypothetical protein
MKKDMKLPDMEHKFHIQLVGEETKLNWTGDFLFRRPTLRERGMIEVLKTRLNNDLLTIDPEIAAYNEATAYLRFTLREYPDWWKDSDMGGSLYDANVILEIYNKCIEFEARWREKVYGGRPADVKVGSDEVQELESVVEDKRT